VGPGPGPADHLVGLERAILGGTDPSTVADALSSAQDLAIALVDPTLTVRLVFGGLPSRSPQMSGGIVGRAVTELAPPGVYPGVLDAVAAALRGTGGSLEVRSATTDHTYLVTLTPIHDGPAVGGCLVVVRDVAPPHPDSRLLSELTDVFEVSFNRSPAGQALVSPTGLWLRINPALERLLDRDARLLLGTDVGHVTHPDDVGPEDELRAAVLRNGSEGYAIDKRVVRADGTAVAVRAEMTAIRDADGAVRGFVAHVVAPAVWDAPFTSR
jgi:PAS domain S-box-containing protein